MGVRKNTAQSITRRQRKQSKKADHIRLSFERLVPEYSVLTKLVLFSANASAGRLELRNGPLNRQTLQSKSLFHVCFSPNIVDAVQ